MTSEVIAKHNAVKTLLLVAHSTGAPDPGRNHD
jgi:hypothetical protein